MLELPVLVRFAMPHDSFIHYHPDDPDTDVRSFEKLGPLYVEQSSPFLLCSRSEAYCGGLYLSDIAYADSP